MPKSKVDFRGVRVGDVAQRFLDSKKPSTKMSYEKCMKRFVYFYEGGLREFIDKIEEEMRVNQDLPLADRVRPGEDTIRGFIAWHEEVGYSNNSARQSIATIQNALKFYGISMSSAFIEMPPARPMRENAKHKWTLDEMKQFVHVAEYIRDKAFIVLSFQTGLGIGDIVDMNYGDVSRGLDEGKLPLLLRLYRKKTDVEHKTFLGRDAVSYLREYLRTRENLKGDDPLFTMLGSSRRVTDGAIQRMLRKYATKLDFIHKEDLENGFNPARPHSLRSAFRSRLTGKMDGSLIEFFMGKLVEDRKTYINMPEDELAELYANYEHLLSIEKTSKQEVEEQVLKPLSEKAVRRIQGLESQILKFANQNADLESRLKDLETQIGLDSRKYERGRDELGELIKELLDRVAALEKKG